MKDEEIRKWIDGKLDDDTDPEKIKEALEDRGWDTSVLDEMLDQDTQNEDSDEESVQASENQSEDSSREEEQSDNIELDQGHSVSKSQSKDLNKSHQVEKAENIAENLETSVSDNLRNILAVIFLSVALITVGFALIPTDLGEQQNTEDQVTKSSNDLYPPESFEGVEVELKQGIAKPSRPNVEPGNQVAFINNNSYKLRIEFEGGGNDLRLPAKSYGTRSFNTITYYSGFRNGTESVKGSIFVR